MRKCLHIMILGFLISLPCHGRIAYVADYDSLQIIDVTDPLNPFRLGACWTADTYIHHEVYFWDVAVKDTIAYVACQIPDFLMGPISAINVKDPISSYFIGDDWPFWNGNLLGDPVAIYICGNYLYVAVCDNQAYNGGVAVLNISNPSSMETVAYYDTPGHAIDIFVVGDLIFVADYDGLQILRHIHMPVEENAKCKVQNTKLMIYPNPFSERAIVRVQGVGVSKVAADFSLRIYDIVGRLVKTFTVTDNQRPITTITWDGRDENGLRVKSGVYFCQLKVQSEKLKVVKTQKLIKMDGVTLLGSLRLEGVKSLKEPSPVYFPPTDTIVRVGAIKVPGHEVGVVVKDNICYLANGYGLAAVNVFNPASPSLLDTLKTMAGGRNVDVGDTLAYIHGGIHFYTANVSNPNNLQLLGWCYTYYLSQDPWGVCAADTIGYVCSSDAGLRIINVADPENPVEISRYDTPGIAINLRVLE